MRKAGLTEVVFWDEIKDKLPPNFKVLPVAVTPRTASCSDPPDRTSRENHPGLIISTLPPSNEASRFEMTACGRSHGRISQQKATAKLAPQGLVQEIGQVLPRLFHFMATTPKDHEMRLSNEVDLSDGFWCLIVEPSQECTFCHIMPNPPGGRVWIAMPSALQVEWAENPACRDGPGRNRVLLGEKVELPAHPFEMLMESADAPKEEHRSIGLHVDDCMLRLVESDD